MGLLLTLTHPYDVELLVIRHKGGREEFLDDVLEQVIASWKAIFEQDEL